MKILIVFLAVIISACAQESVHEVAGVKSEYRVDCSGSFKNWQVCYEKIALKCGAYGYEVISSTLDGNSIRGKESAERVINFRCMQ